MLTVVSLWYHATLKGSEPLETRSLMKASASAVLYCQPHLFRQPVVEEGPLTKPLCPAPPLPILSNISEFSAVKDPPYTAAGSTAAVAVTRHVVHHRVREKDNILNLRDKASFGRSSSLQMCNICILAPTGPDVEWRRALRDKHITPYIGCSHADSFSCMGSVVL